MDRKDYFKKVKAKYDPNKKRRYFDGDISNIVVLPMEYADDPEKYRMELSQRRLNRAFNKAHLKAYLAGDSVFPFGHTYTQYGSRTQQMYKVKEIWF
jgi:hypothetical protein